MAASDQLLSDAADLLDRRDYFGAQQRIRRMVEDNPRDPRALRLAARLATETGHLERAIEIWRTVCELAPREPLVRIGLGEAYRELGRFGEAIGQFDRALKLERNCHLAIGAKAETLEEQGAFSKAERLLAPTAGGNLTAETGAVWIRLLTRRGDVDEAIKAGRAILAGERGESLALRHTAFALAAALEKAGDYEAALNTAHRANRICAPAFDPGAFTAHIDELIELFTAEAVASLPRPAAPSELLVFIVGMPRTGSTLVERMIHAHPKAFGAGERHTLLTLANRLGRRTGSSAPYPRSAFDLRPEHIEGIAGEVIEGHAALAPEAERVANKDLSNLLRLWLVAAALPKARVIYCTRDDVNTALSCYMARLPTHAAPWASDFDHIATVLRGYQRLMRHWREATDLEILEVNYEEMVSDQEGQSRRLIEFLGLAWDEACLRPHQVSRRDRTLSYDQVTRPVYQGSKSRAERFGPALDPLRRALQGAPEAGQ